MSSLLMESSHPMETCGDPTFSIAAIFRRMFRNNQVAEWLLSRDLEPPTMITAEMLKDSITSESRIITRETNNERNPSSQTGKRAASSSSSGANDGSAMDRGYGTTFFKKFDRVVASGNSSSSSDAVELVPRDGTAEPETIACVLHGMCGNYAFITVADTRIPFAFLERGSDVMPGVRRMVVELTCEDTFIMVCYWKANGRSSMIALRYPHDMSKISHRCFLLIAPYPANRYPTPEDVMEVGWIAAPYRCQFCLLRGNSECECSPAVIKRTRPQPPPVERQTPWNMWSFIYGCYEAGFNRYNISLYNYEKRIGASAQVIYHINPTFENVKRHAHGYQHYVNVIEPVYTSKTLGWRVTGSDQQLDQSFMVPKLELERKQRSDFNGNDRDADELKTTVAQDEQHEPRAVNSSLGARLSFATSKMSLSKWMVNSVQNGTGLVSKSDLLLTIPAEAERPEPKSLDSYMDIPALFGPGIASRSELSASNMLPLTTSGIMSALIAGWGTGVDFKVGASMMMPTVPTALSDHDPQNVEQLAQLPSKMKRKRRVREYKKASGESEEKHSKAKQKIHSKGHEERSCNDDNDDDNDDNNKQQAAGDEEFNKDKQEALAFLAEIDTMDLHHDTHCSCRLCGTPFTRKYDLKRHIKMTHLDFRNFECDLCGKKFKRKQHLNIHKTLVHEKASMNLACKYCQSVLTSESNYRRHLRQVHQRDPWKEEELGSAAADVEEEGEEYGTGASASAGPS